MLIIQNKIKRNSFNHGFDNIGKEKSSSSGNSQNKNLVIC